MRCLRVGLAAGVAAVLGFAIQASAAPLDLKQVSAEAQWLGHIDFDAVRASTVVKKAVDKAKERHKDIEQHLAIVRGMIGMDPTTDLHGITLYGTQIGKPSGVLIVHAKVDQNRLLGLAQALPNRETTKYGQYEISSWTRQRGEHSHTLSVAFPKDELLVVASGVEQLSKALDVLDGKGAGTGDGAPLAGNVPPGTTVLFRVAGIAGANLQCCNSPVVKQAESFRFVTGEHEGQSFFRARVTMTNSEIAGQLNQVVQGGHALARLHGGNESETKLVNGLREHVEGNTLTVLWSASAGDVWSVIEQHAKHFEEMRAKMRQRMGKRHHGGPRGRGEAPAKKPANPEEDF